jgi:Flp pilus assembly protein TadG
MMIPRNVMLKPFLRNEDGNLAVVFAAAAVPLIAITGFTSDYAKNAQRRSNLQAAMDAAMLNHIDDAKRGTPVADLKTMIVDQVKAQTKNQTVSMPANPTFSSDGTTLCATVIAQAQNTFVTLVGQSSTMSAYACSKFNTDTYEIAIVVDNSGSMKNSAGSGSETKMAAAKTAAKDLVSIMSTAVSSDPSAPIRSRFSLVPFAAAVNIGAGNKDKAFMDTGGNSSFHWLAFKRPAGVTWLPTSRFDMFTQMGVAWAGCVEERPSPYMTSDDKADAAIADTLYVPFLYPDGNDANTSTMNDYLSDTGGVCQTNDKYQQADDQTTFKDEQSKLCKYKTTSKKTGDSRFGSGFPVGPNLLCSTKALTPLTTSKADIDTAINNMAPLGDTNVMSGVMWGWRTISPNGPFNDDAGVAATGTQKARPYGFTHPNGASNHKIIVLLTDGDNHWGGQSSDGNGYSGDSNKSAYNAFGWFWQNRIGGASSPTTPSNAESKMNDLTKEACTKAKAAGVKIYTVGLTAADGISNDGKAVLKDCSSGDGYHFVAANGDQLKQTFKAIAASMSAVRLSE